MYVCVRVCVCVCVCRFVWGCRCVCVCVSVCMCSQEVVVQLSMFDNSMKIISSFLISVLVSGWKWWINLPKMSRALSNPS